MQSEQLQGLKHLLPKPGISVSIISPYSIAYLMYRAAKAKEAAEALAAAADNNSDSDSKRPSSGTIDEDSFIDDE